MLRHRIIEEASELFARSGVKSTTMDDIARHLGISKRTIYENFRDKEMLLIACMNAVAEENKAFTKKVFSESGNVAEAIVALLQKNAEQASQWRMDMLNDIRKYYPQVYKDYLLSHVDKHKGMEKMVQKGMNEGVFRSNLNPQIIASFFCTQHGVVAMNDKDMEKFSLTEIFENMVMTFLRGICTSRGIEIIDSFKANTSLK